MTHAKEQARRSETVIHDLRRRNGELLIALTAVSPEAAARLTPQPDFQTRFAVLDRIVEHATSLALRSDTGQDISGELELLIEAVKLNEDYWLAVEKDRRRRAEIAARGAETRKSKEAMA